MKTIVCFDLHDTLVNSTRAWLIAFKKMSKDNYKKIKRDYISGMSRKDICKKYNVDYYKTKLIYRENLKVKRIILWFYYRLMKKYNTCIITNASKERAIEDLKHCEIRYKKLFSSEDGHKPENKYIKKIMIMTNSDFLILVGNKDEDILTLENTKSFIIKRGLTILKIYVNIIMHGGRK